MLNIGITIPGRVSGLGGFNGNFASLFPTAYQVVQSDRGLTYGGTMLATAGNTSTATMALSGTLASRPVPIWIVLDVSGIIADIYYDGLGVTPAMSGVSVLGGIPIALTGAASGLTITPSAGTLVANNSWKATCSALADQSGNGFHYTQATAAAQPVVTLGLNGKPGLQFVEGRSTFLNSSCALPAPGTTPWMICAVFTMVANSSFGRIFTDGNFMGLIANNGTTSVLQYGPNGLQASAAITLGTPVAVDTQFSNSAADFLKVGASAPVTCGPAGSAASAGRMIGGNLAFATVDLYALIYVPVSGYTAAWRAAVANYYGGSVAV